MEFSMCQLLGKHSDSTACLVYKHQSASAARLTVGLPALRSNSRLRPLGFTNATGAVLLPWYSLIVASSVCMHDVDSLRVAQSLWTLCAWTQDGRIFVQRVAQVEVPIAKGVWILQHFAVL
eukprot:5706937-Amphidinium_carterae.2